MIERFSHSGSPRIDADLQCEPHSRWPTGSLAALIGGVLQLANWPWTIFGIMPMLYDAYSIPASYRFLILFLEILSTRTGGPKQNSVARLHELTYSVRTIEERGRHGYLYKRRIKVQAV